MQLRQLAFALAAVAFAVGCASDAPDVITELDRNRALIAAAWDGDVERARQLIDDGADVNFQDDTRQSAYLISTSEGDAAMLDLMLEHGADVSALDSYRGTGLIRAAHRGHVAVVSRLLETDIEVDHVNDLGWTALLEAIILGDGSDRYVSTVEMLLEAGADPTIPTRHGTSPVEAAEERGQQQVLELLLAALDE